MSEFIYSILLPVLITFIASSGFWAYISNIKDKKTMQTELLIGLAHDRLVTLGLKYVTRGWISQDEYENLNVYLYKPYEKLGGNGSVKRLMMEVDKLPIRKESLIRNDELGDTQP